MEPTLDRWVDGLEAIDLGIIGECQYAVTLITPTMMGEVMRRKASEAGTYGGWRWECGSSHPSNHASAFGLHANPVMVALATRIALVRQVALSESL